MLVPMLRGWRTVCARTRALVEGSVCRFTRACTRWNRRWRSHVAVPANCASRVGCARRPGRDGAVPDLRAADGVAGVHRSVRSRLRRQRPVRIVPVTNSVDHAGQARLLTRIIPAMKSLLVFLLALLATSACVDTNSDSFVDEERIKTSPTDLVDHLPWYVSVMAYEYDSENILAGMQELENAAHAAYNADSGMLRKCNGNPAITGHLMYASPYGHRCAARGVRMFRTTPLEESQEAWKEVLDELLRGSVRVRFDADIRSHILLIAGVASERAGVPGDYTGTPFVSAPVQWGDPAVLGSVVAVIGTDADVERDSDDGREIVPVLSLSPAP